MLQKDKTIIAIGYYDDFARFFLEIKKDFYSDKNIKFYYLSLYLSGFLYFLARFQKVTSISLKACIKSLLKNKKYKNLLSIDSDAYKGFNLNDIVKYHLRLNPALEVKLKKQAMSYIDILENSLNKIKPDYIILSGDSRMSIEILDKLASNKNIPTFHFEQGPFGTTILDNKGVNANASFRNKLVVNKNLTVKEKQDKVNQFFKRTRPSKYKRNSIYRGSDYIFQFLTKKINLLPPDIILPSKPKVQKTIYKEIKENTNKVIESKRIFLLILQVPEDVNMVYHSPFYDKHSDIVKDIYNNLPEGANLLVREHPLYKGKYEQELYSFMVQKNIPLDQDGLYQSIAQASVVIVNNSTVGIEAISQLKSVVVLGHSYYDNDLICLKLKEQSQLKEVLIKSINFKPNNEDVINFLFYFTQNILIDGHFRDEKLIMAPEIKKRVFA